MLEELSENIISAFYIILKRKKRSFIKFVRNTPNKWLGFLQKKEKALLWIYFTCESILQVS